MRSGGYSQPESHGVIPIRGTTPATSIAALTVLPTAPARPRVRNVPVDRRPWRILLVPPTPGARTRAFDLARWQARLLLSALVMLLLLAAGAVTAVIVALDSPDLLATSTEVASLRDRLGALEDSLALARAVLADGEVASADSSGTAPDARAAALLAARARAPLFARVRARAATRSPAISTLGIVGLPVIGAIVSEFSNARRHPILHILRPHLGIDIAAARGTRVAAPADGRVTYVGRKFSFGLTMEIEHADGITTRYAHLRSALVHEGQLVVRGASIATVGSSGLTTGPHLHYEVAVNGRPVDPLRFRMPQLGDSPPAPSAAATHEATTTPSEPR